MVLVVSNSPDTMAEATASSPTIETLVFTFEIFNLCSWLVLIENIESTNVKIPKTTTPNNDAFSNLAK